MVANIVVPLRPESRAALQQLAHAERRDAKQQAAFLVESALRDAGYLPGTAERQTAEAIEASR